MANGLNSNGATRMAFIPPRPQKDILLVNAPSLRPNGFVLGALADTTKALKGDEAMKDATAFLNDEPGRTEGVAKLTAKLDRANLDRNERLLLSTKGVYAKLVKAAIEKGGVRPEDTLALFDAVRRGLNADGGPRQVFAVKLLKRTIEQRGLKVDKALEPKIVDDLRRLELPTEAAKAEAIVLEVIEGWRAKGTVKEAVSEYATIGKELEPGNLTEDVKSSMVDFLKELGVKFPEDEKAREANIKAGKYDEYFALAYQQARAQRDGGTRDPIDAVRQKGVVPDWKFVVDPFDTAENQGIIPENILAAGALDYIYNLGERLGIFRLADMVVVKWGSGAIDLDPGESSAKLYRYWKLRSERTSPEERAMLYSRVLSYGDAPMLEGMVANQAFPTLWGNLMTAVADYIARVEEKKTEENSVSRQRIYQATKQLQYNLTEFSAGMAQMQINEMYHHLKEARGVLEDPQIVDYFGAGRRKTIWTVIERGSKEWFQESPNIAAIRDLALEGNKVFQWIARFDQSTASDQEFLELKDSAESWILAQGAVGPAATSPAPEEEADEVPGEEAKDEFDADWDK